MGIIVEIITLLLVCVTLLNAQTTYTLTKHFQKELQAMADAKQTLLDYAERISKAADEIKGDIQGLKDQLAAGTITNDDVIAALGPIADKLDALNAETPPTEGTPGT
jgi:cell division protein FtsX